jgi:hypothetical protein
MHVCDQEFSSIPLIFETLLQHTPLLIDKFIFNIFAKNEVTKCLVRCKTFAPSRLCQKTVLKKQCFAHTSRISNACGVIMQAGKIIYTAVD